MIHDGHHETVNDPARLGAAGGFVGDVRAAGIHHRSLEYGAAQPGGAAQYVLSYSMLPSLVWTFTCEGSWPRARSFAALTASSLVANSRRNSPSSWVTSHCSPLAFGTTCYTVLLLPMCASRANGLPVSAGAHPALRGSGPSDHRKPAEWRNR
jgi:hypothetical protein